MSIAPKLKCRVHTPATSHSAGHPHIPLRPTREPSSSRPSERNPAVEALRIFAAYLIVWYHSGVWGSTWAYAGLSVFVILTLQFTFGDNYDRPRPIRSLSRTFLVPWALCFALYETLYVVVGRPVLAGYDNPVIWLLAGPQIHLWYLPFIFTVSLLANHIKQLLTPDSIFTAAVALSLLVLVTIPLWRPWSLAVGAPFIQYCQAISAVLFGVVIGLHSRARFGTLGLTAVLGAMLLAGCVAPDAAWLVLPHLIGGILVLAAKRITIPVGRLNFGPLAKHMLGVYLIHPLLIRLAPQALLAAGPLGALAIFFSAVAFVGAVSFAWTNAKALSRQALA